MKNKSFVFAAVLLVVLPLMARAEMTEEYDGKKVMFYRDGIKIATITMAGEDSFNNSLVSAEGEVINGDVVHYIKGVKRSVLHYKNNLPDGDVKIYNDKGGIFAEYRVHADIMDGEARIYDDKGRLKYRSNYARGINQGKQLEYYPETGKIKYKFWCKDGKDDGLAFTFNEAGRLVRCSVYSKGTVVTDLNFILMWICYVFTL